MEIAKRHSQPQETKSTGTASRPDARPAVLKMASSRPDQPRGSRFDPCLPRSSAKPHRCPSLSPTHRLFRGLLPLDDASFRAFERTYRHGHGLETIQRQCSGFYRMGINRPRRLSDGLLYFLLSRQSRNTEPRGSTSRFPFVSLPCHLCPSQLPLVPLHPLT